MTRPIDEQMVSIAEEQIETFGEEVTYFPGDGAAIVIRAVVRREPEGPLEVEPRGSGFEADLRILNSAEGGVVAPDDHTDYVDVAATLGGTPVRCRVVRLLASDAGSHVLKVVR